MTMPTHSTSAVPAIVSTDQRLSSLTTLHVGGNAAAYAEPRSLDELQRCLDFAADRQLRMDVLGRGSNLLVADAGVAGMVVNMRRFGPTPQIDGHVLRAGAGTALPKLAATAARYGAAHYEFLIGIPGTVGGGIAMNAGIRGHDISDLLVSTDVLNPRTGELSTVLVGDLGLAHRTSRVLTEQLVVVGAAFRCQPGAHAPADLKERQQWLKDSRARRQPLGLKTCGSIFKHPGGTHAAGWYLEQCGLKGHRIGGAHVSNKHANWIVNDASATAADIDALVRLGRRQVQSRFDVQLEPEVVRWGFQNADE